MKKLAHLAAFSLCVFLLGCGPNKSGLELGEERLSDNEAKNTAAMIDAIKAISLQRNPTGTIKRFNQSKTLGCFDATFTVLNSLDNALQQGIFATVSTYPAKIRFASATKDDDREKDFRGMSIQVQGVAGDSLWGDSGQQDFLLNSYPALFAANPADFLDFINATRDGQLWRYFITPGHFYSLAVVLKGREKITNPFSISYWSTTPYRFGDDASRAVKYAVRPCSTSPAEIDIERHRDFLSDAMQAHLRRSDACFDFMVQFQTDADSMPIENAAIIWNESVSPFIKLAEIRIADGTTSTSTVDNCETMTFNPWQSLAAHQPLGSINRARKPIYAEIGAFRQQENRLRETR